MTVSSGTPENLRVHFYGVQGSGSTFPGATEQEAFRQLTDFELLRQIFKDIQEHLDGDRLVGGVEGFLGGSLSKDVLLAYRDKLQLPRPRVYGGWTTCVRVETADDVDLVFDCGSGFRICAADLQAKWGTREKRDVFIFGSHSHLDHTEGFDQAAVCFDPRNRIHIFGNCQFLYALDSYLGIFSKHVRDDVLGVQTPINYMLMPAHFHGTELRKADAPPPRLSSEFQAWDLDDSGADIWVGETRVTAFEVYHPAPCLAYRVERRGKVFVYCTDHELRHGGDAEHPGQVESEAAEARVVAHSAGADLLYRDGQYLRSEYDGLTGIGGAGPVPRLDWGHSCIEDIQEMAARCGIGRTLIGHHDPNRGWSERNWLDDSLERSEGAVELARAGTVVELS